MTVHSPAPSRPHTDAALALLDAASILAERGKPPAGAGWQGQEGASAFVSYVVVWPHTPPVDGNVAEPYEYLLYRWQITAVAATATGAEAVMDRARAALIGHRLTIPGRASYPIVDGGLSQPIRADDTTTPRLFYAVAEFAARTQPA